MMVQNTLPLNNNKMLRLDGIDILRGIAVISVILYHFFILLGLTHSNIYPYIHAFGALGVPLFFIISGYLIYRSIDRNITEKGIKQGSLNYIFHRLFRILPAYYFNLLVVFIMASFVLSNDFFYSASFFRQFFSHLTFTSYFIHKSAGFGINGAYWTLSIEMLWYVIAPFMFIFIKKTRSFIFIALMSLIYIWGVSYGLFDSLFDLNEKSANYRLQLLYYITQLPGQINYFIAGILIYKYTITFSLVHSSRNFLFSILLILFFIGIIGYFNLHPDFLIKHIMILVVTSLLFILLYTSKVKWGSFLEWIGKISYSLYLWHMPILFAMKQSDILAHRSLLEASLFFILILLSISSMSYYFIEEGGFTLRKKLTNKFFVEKAVR